MCTCLPNQSKQCSISFSVRFLIGIGIKNKVMWHQKKIINCVSKKIVCGSSEEGSKGRNGRKGRMWWKQCTCVQMCLWYLLCDVMSNKPRPVILYVLFNLYLFHVCAPVCGVYECTLQFGLWTFALLGMCWHGLPNVYTLRFWCTCVTHCSVIHVQKDMPHALVVLLLFDILCQHQQFVRHPWILPHREQPQVIWEFCIA